MFNVYETVNKLNKFIGIYNNCIQVKLSIVKNQKCGKMCSNNPYLQKKNDFKCLKHVKAIIYTV